MFVEELARHEFVVVWEGARSVDRGPWEDGQEYGGIRRVCGGKCVVQ